LKKGDPSTRSLDKFGAEGYFPPTSSLDNSDAYNLGKRKSKKKDKKKDKDATPQNYKAIAKQASVDAKRMGDTSKSGRAMAAAHAAARACIEDGGKLAQAAKVAVKAAGENGGQSDDLVAAAGVAAYEFTISDGGNSAEGEAAAKATCVIVSGGSIEEAIEQCGQIAAEKTLLHKLGTVDDAAMAAARAAKLSGLKKDGAIKAGGKAVSLLYSVWLSILNCWLSIVNCCPFISAQ
jgi:hypothetical protein